MKNEYIPREGAMVAKWKQIFFHLRLLLGFAGVLAGMSARGADYTWATWPYTTSVFTNTDILMLVTNISAGINMSNRTVSVGNFMTRVKTFNEFQHTHQTSATGGTLDAAAIQAGTLDTARLGSGTADDNAVLRGDSSWVRSTTSGQVFRIDSAGNVAGWGAVDLADSDATTGTLLPARLGAGTADTSAFLRGDSLWTNLLSGTLTATRMIASGDGTLTAPAIALGTDGGVGLYYQGSGILSVSVKSNAVFNFADLGSGTGVIYPDNDNAVDLSFGSSRFKAATFTGSVNAGTNSIFGFLTRTKMGAPADGQLLLQNNAGSDFTRLQLGGTTASFPALKRSTTNLHVRLSDDSGFTGIQASDVTATNGAFSGSLTRGGSPVLDQSQIDSMSELEGIVGVNIIDSSEFNATALGAGTNNNLIALSKLKLTGPLQHQPTWLSGTTPTVDLSAADKFNLIVTGNTTFTLSNKPSGTNVDYYPWFIYLTNSSETLTRTLDLGANVRPTSKRPLTSIGPTNEVRIAIALDNGDLTYSYLTDQSGPVLVADGGTGLTGSTNGDLFTGNTGGSVVNVVKHPGSNGKMLYSTNAAPYWTVGDAPTGSSSSFDPTDDSKYFWRESFTELFTDGDRRYGDHTWTLNRITSGGIDRMAAEKGHAGGWRFFPEADVNDALFLSPANFDSGELDNKPYIFGTNSPAMTVKFKLRLANQINGTDDEQLRFGFTDLQAAQTNRATNCIIFQIDRVADTTQWGCVTATNSTATVTDSNTNFDTNWVALAFTISQHATNVVFSINGSTVQTNTTNIPWEKQMRLTFAGHWVAGAQTITHLDNVLIYEP